MNELLKPDWFGGTENGAGGSPAVNIKESETGYELEMAVPGRKKNPISKLKSITISSAFQLKSKKRKSRKKKVIHDESFVLRLLREHLHCLKLYPMIR